MNNFGILPRTPKDVCVSILPSSESPISVKLSLLYFLPLSTLISEAGLPVSYNKVGDLQVFRLVSSFLLSLVLPSKTPHLPPDPKGLK